MPLYEYHCEKCDANVELLVRSAEQKLECPECGGTRLTKLLSVVSGHVAAGGGACRSTPPPAGCGRPQCGMGGCGMGM